MEGQMSIFDFKTRKIQIEEYIPFGKEKSRNTHRTMYNDRFK